MSVTAYAYQCPMWRSPDGIRELEEEVVRLSRRILQIRLIELQRVPFLLGRLLYRGMIEAFRHGA